MPVQDGGTNRGVRASIAALAFTNFNKRLVPFHTACAHMHPSPEDERGSAFSRYGTSPPMAGQLLRPPPDRRHRCDAVCVGVDPGSKASAAAPAPNRDLHTQQLRRNERGSIIRNPARNEKEYRVRGGTVRFVPQRRRWARFCYGDSTTGHAGIGQGGGKGRVLL